MEKRILVRSDGHRTLLPAKMSEAEVQKLVADWGNGARIERRHDVHHDLVVANRAIEPKITVLTSDQCLEIAKSTKALIEIQELKDEADLEVASGHLVAAKGVAKQTHEARLNISRPIHDLLAEIKAQVDNAVKPLEDEMDRVMEIISATQKRIEAEREAAIIKARQEAEAKAREEAEKMRAQVEAAQVAEEELFGPPDDDEDDIVIPQAVIVEPPERPLPPLKSAVQTRKRKQVVIVDKLKVPWEIEGVPLLKVDERAVKKLMNAGIEVPGCEWQEVEIKAIVRR